jgi:hypothetical protein
MTVDDEMRELGDREHVDEVEEQLKRGRPLPLAVPSAQMG